MLITVHIPFYHFCTVCCTRDLVLLLDCRKGSILWSSSWLFYGAGLFWVSKGRRVAIAGPPRPPLLPPCSHSRDGMGLREAWQSAVNSQGSCFLSWCHLLFLSGEQWGTAPDPLSLPPAGMRVADSFLREGGVSFLPSSFCCCF